MSWFCFSKLFRESNILLLCLSLSIASLLISFFTFLETEMHTSHAHKYTHMHKHNHAVKQSYFRDFYIVYWLVSRHCSCGVVDISLFKTWCWTKEKSLFRPILGCLLSLVSKKSENSVLEMGGFQGTLVCGGSSEGKPLSWSLDNLDLLGQSVTLACDLVYMS